MPENTTFLSLIETIQDTLIEEVQYRARLSSWDEAENATQATLDTIAGYAVVDAAENITLQLPLILATYLQEDEVEANNDFAIDDFFQQVSEREGVELPYAVDHALTVIEVIEETLAQRR